MIGEASKLTHIDYYISTNSPWTYLGSARFIDMVQRYGATVSVKPAKFAEVFAQTGGLPLPKRSSQRQAYRMMELARWREELGIAILDQPQYFPSDEAPSVRLIIAAAHTGKDALALSAEIGRALWERDENIADIGVLNEAAARAGLNAEALRADGPPESELDAIWEANTAEAVGRGVFGAPSYRFADGEIMWGQDRVMFVEKKLAKLA